MTIQQWDTFLDGVFPLDRNRLTREWFHSGKAVYSVVGEGADEFEGTLELGYQVGFPWSLGVGINFSYTTPNILLDDADISPGRLQPAGLGHHPEPVPGCVDLALTWATAPASRKSPPSRWTSKAPTARWRWPTPTAP